MTANQFSLHILYDSSGYLGREVPGPPRQLFQEIGLLDGHLTYADSHEVVGSTRRALDDFMRLAEPTRGDESGKDVLRFAQKWGVLMLCKTHHLPITHALFDPTRAFSKDNWKTCDLDDVRTIRRAQGHPLKCEPIAAWRELADRATRTLRLAAQLRNNREVGTFSDARDDLINRINWWLELGGGLKLALAESDAESDDEVKEQWPSGLEVQIDHRGFLIGILAAQIWMAATAADGMMTCAACARPFFEGPAKRPRTGRRAFCKDCGPKAAARFASRDYRARQKEN